MAKWFNNILRSLAGTPKENLPTVQTPSSSQAVYVSNAQSWNPETHPEGRGDSHYIEDIDYKDGVMDVKFRNGFEAELNNVDPNEVKDFVRSDSKGRFYNNHFADRPYTEV